MAQTLEGRVALVTGGSSGIGRATALAFSWEGAKVVVSDVDVEGGDETVRMIKEAGGEALFVRTDVSKVAEVEAMVNRTVEAYGRLDCAFNNAGVEGDLGPTADCSEENWNRVISVNLTGVWLCMKYEIPQMIKQGGGAIVNTSSSTGLLAAPGLPAYSASKHGVIGLTKSAALECAKAGIRINVVCPANIHTPMVERIVRAYPEAEARVSSIPVGRMGTPEEVAEAVVWLCSDAASFVTAHTMLVDGGFTAQ